LGAALQADGEYEVRGDGLKHQKEKRSMDHFAGLDVSVKETSVCVVDDTGRIVREVKVASEPEARLAVLTKLSFPKIQSGLDSRREAKSSHHSNVCDLACARNVRRRHVQVVTQARSRGLVSPSSAQLDL
jgi:hypothetical protein